MARGPIWGLWPRCRRLAVHLSLFFFILAVAQAAVAEKKESKGAKLFQQHTTKCRRRFLVVVLCNCRKRNDEQQEEKDLAPHLSQWHPGWRNKNDLLAYILDFKTTAQQRAPASQAGIRVVNLRIPAVLGGAMLGRAGFRVGNGKQWMSWVGRDELASIIEFALRTETLCGPVNAVSPNPLRSAEFATVATKALQQKPGGAMPALIARLVFGEMGEEFMLASRRAQPAKLIAAGYQFRYPDLACTLQHEQEVMSGELIPRASV